jgi:hypothetical protein
LAGKRSSDHERAAGCFGGSDAPQHPPPSDMPPKRSPVLNAPAVEDIAGEQSVVEEETPGDAAVVAGPCVVVLGVSPGNCRAV